MAAPNPAPAAPAAADVDSPNTVMFNNLRKALMRFRTSDSLVNLMCQVLFPDEVEDINGFINFNMEAFNEIVQSCFEEETHCQAELKILGDLKTELLMRAEVTVRTHSHLLLALEYTSPTCVIRVLPNPDEAAEMEVEMAARPSNRYI